MHLTLHSLTSVKSIMNDCCISDMYGEKTAGKFTFTSVQSKLIFNCVLLVSQLQ